MSNRHLLGACFACAAAFSTAAHAQKLRPLDDLSKAMSGSLVPLETLRPTERIADCQRVSPEELDALPGGRGGYTQWIYNSAYSWAVVRTYAGSCVLLKYPERRGLSRDEAQVLLSASVHEFPVDNGHEAIDPNRQPGRFKIRPDSDSGIRLDVHADGRLTRGAEKLPELSRNWAAEPTSRPRAVHPSIPQGERMGGFR